MISRGRTEASGLVLACVVSAALGAAGMLVATLAWDTPQQQAAGRGSAGEANDGDGSTPVPEVGELQRTRQELDRLRKENEHLHAAQLAAAEDSGSPDSSRVPVAPTDPPGESPPVAPPDAHEVLAALRSATLEGNKGAIWGHVRQLQGLLRSDTGNAVSAILDALALHPDATLLETLGHLLARKDLPLDPEQAAALRDALYQAALDAEEPADARAALATMQRLLNNHDLPGAKLEDAQVVVLSDMLSDGTANMGVRREAMRLLGNQSGGHLAFTHALRGVLAGDGDSRMRAEALKELRRASPDESSTLLLDLLQHDPDPVVLWEAARPASFLTFSSGSIGEFKQAYRDLLHREIDDRARGQAAQSLALIATLDGDAQIPAELRHLAGSTADASLAEFARFAARELEAGTATIASLAQAWQRWHRTIDRDEFP